MFHLIKTDLLYQRFMWVLVTGLFYFPVKWISSFHYLRANTISDEYYKIEFTAVAFLYLSLTLALTLNLLPSGKSHYRCRMHGVLPLSSSRLAIAYLLEVVLIHVVYLILVLSTIYINDIMWRNLMAYNVICLNLMWLTIFIMIKAARGLADASKVFKRLVRIILIIFGIDILLELIATVFARETLFEFSLFFKAITQAFVITYEPIGIVIYGIGFLVMCGLYVWSVGQKVEFV